MPDSLDFGIVRRLFVCILLFLRGYSVKPALVWNDDGHFLLLCPGTYFHEKADRSGTQQTVLSYRGLWYIAAEYTLWTTGCFFSSNSIGNPYFWMDILLTGSLLGLFPATRKAVEA